MKDENPFVVTGHIKPELFCDREKESARLIKLITNGNNVVIRSERRMGKTGLIQYCFDKKEISDHYYTFFVDILHTTCLQELVHELSKNLYEQTVPYGKKITHKLILTLKSLSGNFGFDAASGLPTFNFGLGNIEQPELTLEEIFIYLQQADRPCIVAIDEFQQIDHYPEKNIDALLRSLIQKIDNCHFIFAGSEKHLLSLMFDNGSRPFYRSADNISLEAIARERYVSFIFEKFNENGRSISTVAAQNVYDMFEGHTFYVQKIMNESFSNTPKGEVCDEETVNYSLQTVLDDNNTLFKEILSRIPIRQKELLYAIASEGWASKLTSASFMKRHSLSSASSVQAALKQLKDKETIVEDNKCYRVNDRFLGLWIKRMMK